MKKKVTIQLDADYKKKTIPLPLIILLPLIAQKLLIVNNTINNFTKVQKHLNFFI